jgi:hypothetical protein
MVVMPDGHRQSWGGYGKMDNCVRPGDTVETWLEFPNADPLARDLWCGGRGFVQAATLAPQELVDAIGRQIDRPCE